MPGSEIGSWAVAISDATRSTAELDRALRHRRPPVIAQVMNDRLLIDPRTVLPSQEADLVAALQRVLS
jgi:L-seryl-tRNA(Ser) seleniumtransferase